MILNIDILLVETVICRIFYENRCSSGKLTLSQFRKYNMNDILSRLEKRIDLNSVCSRDAALDGHFALTITNNITDTRLLFLQTFLRAILQVLAIGPRP